MGHARSADSRPGSCCAGGGNSRRGPALGASARGGQRRGMRVDHRSMPGGSADGRLQLQHLTQIVKPGASAPGWSRSWTVPCKLPTRQVIGDVKVRPGGSENQRWRTDISGFARPVIVWAICLEQVAQHCGRLASMYDRCDERR